MNLLVYTLTFLAVFRTGKTPPLSIADTFLVHRGDAFNKLFCEKSRFSGHSVQHQVLRVQCHRHLLTLPMWGTV